MKLSIKTWFTFFCLAIVMGLNNIYSVLLTGWGEGGSIVAVILCLLFLTKSERTIINYNLGQTIASAGGSVGFSVSILAAIYYLYPSWNPPLFELAFIVMGISLMGVILAAPLRRYVIHWFFPAGVACATILRAVTSEKDEERKRARNVMGISGFVSSLLTLPTKVSLYEGGQALWNKIPISTGLSMSLDPLLYGIGMVIGPRIGVSMVLGGLLHHTLFIPNITENIAEFTRWTAVGLMTLPAFTSMYFAFMLKSHPTLPPGFHPKEHLRALSGKQWGFLFIIFTLAMLMTMICMQTVFDVNWIYVLTATGIAAPLCFALGKVSSETGINPVRLLAIVLLFIFSMIGNFEPVALLSIGVIGAALAAIAVDLFTDLRTGYLVGANPKHQVVMQLLGVIPVSFVSVYFLHLLASNFGFGEGKYFPAPGAVVWATMAKVFSEGSTSISKEIWLTGTVASLIGILLSLFENWKPTRHLAPSPFAIGMALLLPLEMSLAICAGSLIRYGMLFVCTDKEKCYEEVFQSGSAIFAASALTGIVAIVLISFGILYLP